MTAIFQLSGSKSVLMRILITGGAGFVGTNLIKRLISCGYDCLSIDNYLTGSQENHVRDCIYYNEDLSKTKDFSIFGKFDFVFHLAAAARIKFSFDRPETYFNSNVVGTFNMANHCAKNEIPLIYAGSSSHHGGKFRNPYTFTKDIGEETIRLYQDHFNLKSSTTRFYNVYGPHELTNEHGTLIGRWKDAYLKKEPFVIYGDGSKKRDFTHVDDVVDGLIKILEQKMFGYVFEFGRGESFCVNEIAEMFGCNNIIYKEDKKGEMQETLCNNAFTCATLGWQPKNNVKDYIESIIKKPMEFE